MRKLVRIEKILDIQPISGADRIEVATINNWKVVVGKNEFEINQKVVYFEIDSFLPIRPEYEFLRKSSYKKMADGSEGFRIKTAKFKNQVSQGLITPTTILPNQNFQVGEEVTDILGVIKYEPPIPAELAGKVIGYFPSFIQKSDEERVQNLTDEYTEMRKYKYFASEKLDGTSSTFFMNENIFGVCSRNLHLEFNPDNTFCKIAIQNDIENKLRSLNRNLAIQGEIIGEGIQGNKYKLIGQKLFVFNIFDIDKCEYLSKDEMVNMCKLFNLNTVPTIYSDFTLTETIEELLEIANGQSQLNVNTKREGLVWVSIDSPKRISFKTISNQFLLKYDE